MATSHSIIGASGYYRWSECPGSVALTKDLPPKSNEHAEAGTLAHHFSEKILRNEMTWEEAALIYDEEMVNAVKVYVDFVRKIESQSTWSKVEHGFDMSHLHPGLFGTCDFVAYDEHFKGLTVVDFKYGKGHFVEVENNPQLLYYALGALLTIPMRIEKILLYVVQPRCPRRGNVIHGWVTDLVPNGIEFMMELVHNAKRTELPNAPLKEGSWCFFCPAVGFCPEQHKKRNLRAIEQFSEIPLTQS